MGLVGSGTRSGFAANEMAVPLAGPIRLSARHGWISLHGFNAAASDRVVVDQITRSNSEYFRGPPDARRRGTWFRPFRTGMAGAFGSGPGFSAGITVSGSTLAVARSACSAARINSPIMDGELDRLFLAQSATYGGRIGLRLARSRSTRCRVCLARTTTR